MYQYDIKDEKSIIEFAKKLKNKSLRQACTELVLGHIYKGKGSFGQVLEKFYFQYEPNSTSEPDFKEVGLELKSSPLKQIKNGEFRAKERLVLNIINYLEEAENDIFENSSFWRKNAALLLVFYLYQEHVNFLDYPIHLVDKWCYPDEDLAIIKNDWLIIQNKIQHGLAHELSEGDTFYLGACTKGSKGGNLRSQKGDIKAKQRAFSLKQGYVNHIIAQMTKSTDGIYGKIVQSPKDLKNKTIEEFVLSKFQAYYGKSVEELLSIFNISLNQTSKSFYSQLAKAVLGVELGKKIEEFEKADIMVKTVRLKKDNKPAEHLSFSSFKYHELATEEWDNSSFKKILDHKFLFIFFKKHDDALILEKAIFWNMPNKDILEAEKVWKVTQNLVNEGKIVKEIKKGIRYTYFPKKNDNPVAHIRPHGKNAKDTYPLPTPDALTNQHEYTKHCFWLNDTYVRDAIFSK
jgi:DNA mismatch repair protein MutH